MSSKKFTRVLRNAFITGAILIIPLWITVLLIQTLVNIVADTFALLPPAVQPQTYIPFRGLEVFVALLFIFLIGILANNVFGKKIIRLWELMLAKIPVIKTVYQGIKHLTAGVVSDKKIFTRVVLLQFPIKGLTFIGFVTGEEDRLIPGIEERKYLKVFIPTTPNPTSGFFCYAAEEEVKPLNLTVDEAFKLIISAGYADLGSG